MMMSTFRTGGGNHHHRFNSLLISAITILFIICICCFNSIECAHVQFNSFQGEPCTQQRIANTSRPKLLEQSWTVAISLSITLGVIWCLLLIYLLIPCACKDYTCLDWDLFSHQQQQEQEDSNSHVYYYLEHKVSHIQCPIFICCCSKSSSRSSSRYQSMEDDKEDFLNHHNNNDDDEANNNNNNNNIDMVNHDEDTVGNQEKNRHVVLQWRPWNMFHSLESARHGTIQNAIITTTTTTTNTTTAAATTTTTPNSTRSTRLQQQQENNNNNNKQRVVTLISESEKTIAGGFMTITILILCVISVTFGILNRVDPLTAELDKRNDSVNKQLSHFVMKYQVNVYDVLCDPFIIMNNKTTSATTASATLDDDSDNVNDNDSTIIQIIPLPSPSNHSSSHHAYLVLLNSTGVEYDGTQDMSLHVHRNCFSTMNIEPIAQLRRVVTTASNNSNQSTSEATFVDADGKLPYYQSAAIYSRNFKYSWNITMQQSYDVLLVDATWYSLEPIVDVLTVSDISKKYMNWIVDQYPILQLVLGKNSNSNSNRNSTNDDSTGSDDANQNKETLVMESKDCFMYNSVNSRNRQKTDASDQIQIKFSIDSTVKQRFYESQSSRISRLPLNVLASIGSIIALRSPATYLVVSVLESLSGFFLLKSVVVSIAVLVPTFVHLSVYAAQAISDPSLFHQKVDYYNILVCLNCVVIVVVFHGMLLWNMDFCSRWRQMELWDLWNIVTQPLHMVRIGLGYESHTQQVYHKKQQQNKSKQSNGRIARALFLVYCIVYCSSFVVCVMMACGLIWIHWSCAIASVILELCIVTVLHLIWKLYLKDALSLPDMLTDSSNSNNNHDSSNLYPSLSGYSSASGGTTKTINSETQNLMVIQHVDHTGFDDDETSDHKTDIKLYGSLLSQ